MAAQLSRTDEEPGPWEAEEMGSEPQGFSSQTAKA